MSFGCWLEPLSSSSSVTLNMSPDFMSPFGEGDAETVVLTAKIASLKVLGFQTVS